MPGMPAPKRRSDAATRNPHPDQAEHDARQSPRPKRPATASTPPCPRPPSCSAARSDRSSAPRCRRNSRPARVRVVSSTTSPVRGGNIELGAGRIVQRHAIERPVLVIAVRHAPLIVVRELGQRRVRARRCRAGAHGLARYPAPSRSDFNDASVRSAARTAEGFDSAGSRCRPARRFAASAAPGWRPRSSLAATASSGPCRTRPGSIGTRPAKRSDSVNAGNGTKCITMPLANHIANSRQKPIPSQRCRTNKRFHPDAVHHLNAAASS